MSIADRISQLFKQQYWRPEGNISAEGCNWFPLPSDYTMSRKHTFDQGYRKGWQEIGCMERIRTTHHKGLIRPKMANKPVLDLLTNKEINTYINMLQDKFPSADRLFDHPDATLASRTFLINGKNAVENYVLMNIVRNIWQNPIAVVVMNELVRKYPTMDWIEVLIHEAFTRPILGYQHQQSTLIDFEKDNGLWKERDISALYNRIKFAGRRSIVTSEDGYETEYGRFVRMQTLVSPKYTGTCYFKRGWGKVDDTYATDYNSIWRYMKLDGYFNDVAMLRNHYTAKSMSVEDRIMLLGNISDTPITNSTLSDHLNTGIKALFDTHTLQQLFKSVQPDTRYQQTREKLGLEKEMKLSWRW